MKIKKKRKKSHGFSSSKMNEKKLGKYACYVKSCANHN